MLTTAGLTSPLPSLASEVDDIFKSVVARAISSAANLSFRPSPNAFSKSKIYPGTSTSLRRGGGSPLVGLCPSWACAWHRTTRPTTYLSLTWLEAIEYELDLYLKSIRCNFSLSLFLTLLCWLVSWTSGCALLINADATSRPILLVFGCQYCVWIGVSLT